MLESARRSFASVAFALSVLASHALAAPELKDKEAKELVEAYVAIDRKSEKGLYEQDRILARLAEAEPLDAKGSKAWRKTLEKLWKKLPALEPKSGLHHLWEDEERGLYIVGGETRRPKALFVGMHGGGAGSGDAWSAHGGYNGAVSSEDWLGIYPQVLEKTEHGWTDSGTEEFVIELVERALRTWKLDTDRVFFGGHSMGGYGTWTLGAHHADLVAGLTASAGAPTPVHGPGGLEGIENGVVPNLRNVPFVVYQSDDDPNVPPEANREGARQIGLARERWGGYPFEYWEVSGQGHALPPGGFGALLEKVRDERRDARPEKIVWQPKLRWKRQFYWLWWEEPKSSQTVVAELDRKGNAVHVECGSPAGLRVLLDDELLDLGREVTITVGEREAFRGVPERSLAALVATGAHGDEARTYDVWIELGE